jgi:hypothetical protein
MSKRRQPKARKRRAEQASRQRPASKEGWAEVAKYQAGPNVDMAVPKGGAVDRFMRRGGFSQFTEVF